jgi:hypothetical protein
MKTEDVSPDAPKGIGGTHELRTALTPILARVQLARRCLRRGDHAAADAHLAAAVLHVHGVVAEVERGSRRDG